MIAWIFSVPGAVLAAIGVFVYWVGVVRPFRIEEAEYWEQESPHKVIFKCVIKNRSLLWDRTLTGLSLVEPAGGRSSVQSMNLLDDAAENDENKMKIGKQDRRRFFYALSLSSGTSELKGFVVQAYAGSRSSRPVPLKNLGERDEMYSGGKLLLFVYRHVPELIVLLNKMVLSQKAGRHELGVKLQERVLNSAYEGGGERRVTLYLNQEQADGGIELCAEANCPGWFGVRPPNIDRSTPRGRKVLNLLEENTIRFCRSLEELNSNPEYRETARDWQRYPAYGIIPMIVGNDHAKMTIGILEVESKDQLLPVDTAQLTAMASVLVCAKLLETTNT